MARTTLVVLLLGLLACGVFGDLYLQAPRGSNDRLNEETQDRQNGNRLFDSENNARGGYCWGPPMSYVEGSILPIEWTAQHGCGGPHVTCTEIIQYMCVDTTGPAENQIRDGTTTTTITDNAQTYNQKNGDGTFTYGMMENYQYYQDCKTRDRNKGLFTADQNLNGNAAINTRQNPGGTRSGFECPEERDYFPYWHPTPWKDVAVLTNTLENCKFFQAESQNVKDKNYCQFTPTNTQKTVPNNEAACVAVGGKWAVEKAFGIPPPDCQLAAYSRDNHLGNAGTADETANYTWILPDAKTEPCIDANTCNCALRIRYNITTNESTGLTDEFLDAGDNKLITNNPTLPVEGGQLTLALNTAQYGRTFQDRSFIFKLAPRPQGVSANTKIYNLNVRGKRGNIVQTFPATEYDFVPSRLTVEEGDIVHYQWTGCDTNPGNNAGEGKVKTDRSNIVQIKDLDSNIPLVNVNSTIENHLFESAVLRNRMALIGQDPTKCKITNNDQDDANCAKLNAAPTPYFDGGLVKMNSTGTFAYMSTRNNNFSNRTQKGQLTVTKKKKITSSAGVVAGLIIGAVALAALSIGGLVFYGKKNPHSAVGRFVDNIRMPDFSRSSSSSATTSYAPRRVPLLNSDHGTN